MTTLKGKVALITGSARGIGRAIAEHYALLGAAVAVNYAKDEKSAAETVAAIRSDGGSAVAFQADIFERSPTLIDCSQLPSTDSAASTSSSPMQG